MNFNKYYHTNQGRDHGFPGFCCYYKLHQDPNFDCNSGWDKKYDDFSDSDWAELQSVYEKPSDIDLFTGGLMQKPFNGGLTGKVFNEMKGNLRINNFIAILSDIFLNDLATLVLRQFWFEIS